MRYISVFGRGKTQEPTKEDIKTELKKVKEQFAQVQKREVTIGILLYECSRVASRSAVFVPKGDRILGWRSRGMMVDNFNAPVAPYSVFSEVIGEKNLSQRPSCRDAWEWGTDLAPFRRTRGLHYHPDHGHGQNHRFAIADNGNASTLSASLTYFDTLATMASLSFEIIMLRQKLLDVLVPNL